MPLQSSFHAIVVGAGHNGLVAAAILARAGVRVTVLEAADTLGGACRTETPFRRAPELRCSTGAYLLGPMPPEVIERAGIAIQTTLRRPSGFFLNDAGLPVCFGLENGLAALHPEDRAALQALDATLDILREDIAPLWLRDAVTLEDSILAVRDIHPPGCEHTARQAYRVLAHQSVGTFLDLFRFRDQNLMATLATDGFVGSTGGYFSQGTGLNFLAHNMLRLSRLEVHRGRSLPQGPPDRSWQLVKGGMGAITTSLAEVVFAHGGTLRVNAPASKVLLDSGRAVGVALGQETLDADAVILATDPHRALSTHMVASNALTPLRERLAAMRTPGTSMKINLALSKLPRVRGAESLGDPHLPLKGTVHAFRKGDPIGSLTRAQRACAGGRVPDPADVMVDIYTHSAADDSLRDKDGRHTMSFFVQWLPPGMTQERAHEFAWSLIHGPIGGPDGILPDLPELVEEIIVLSAGPGGGIERHFGITDGHIHHLDNKFAFEQRLPARTPVPGLFLAGAGCHPAGSVIGCAGLIAADAVLAG